MGSVKDIEILESPKGLNPGRGRFHFSDRYSVFDWGEMPDHIPSKGASLCLTSAYFFELLEGRGIKTHYIGLVEGGKVKRLDELRSPSSVMEVELLRVIRPEVREGKYNYGVFKNQEGNFLIPLEIIYRNSLPPGTSVFRRLKEGGLSPQDLGFDSVPEPGTRLPQPFFDLSTKLEETDRYISWEEAAEMAGLKAEELDRIREIVSEVNELITDEVSKLGLQNEDGKIELGFDGERRLMVVDAVGTLDECRFSWQGTSVSKELARIYYRSTPWYGEVEEAKRRDRVHWREMVKADPPPLPPRFKELLSLLYRCFAQELTGREWFGPLPPLRSVLEEMKGFLPQA